MPMPVLATKFFVPVPRPRAVQRPGLVAKLDEGLRAGRKLTLITAPAGFGKSTLVGEWIVGLSRRDPELAVAWISLDESDNDPVRFLSYLVAALGQSSASVDERHLAPEQPATVVVTALINVVSESPHTTLLVLDDFHAIDDSSIQDAVALLVERLPHNLHVVIVSRSDPPLPVARLRARGELTEVRASDLRFTTDEAAAFLGSVMGLSLTPDDVAALETRTEGWIAGLQLAALSLQERTDTSEFIAAFAGSNRFVIDYLVEEVLDRAPEDVREFLVETAVLDRMSGSLCDAVTGRPGGTAMLDTLEKANLFVVPLDDDRRWFRYHHLFADVLKVRLIARDPERTADLHVRASEWFEHNNSPDDAVRHAFDAKDSSRAARLIESAIPAVRKSRQDSTLLGWLATLPGVAIARRPVLRVFSAWSSLVSGDMDSALAQLAEAEHLLTTFGVDGMPTHESEDGDELRSLPVTIELYRAAVAMATGDHDTLKAHAQLALDRASPDDHLGRGAAAGMLGLAASSRGELAEGVAAFVTSTTSLRRAGNLTDALTTTMVTADMLLPLGRLREARAAYESALEESTAAGTNGSPTADLRAGLADVLREQNLIAEATQQLFDAEELGARASSREHHYRWFVAMARVKEAAGEYGAALEFLAEAERSYLPGFFPNARPIGAIRARVLITQGDLVGARAWVSGQGLDATDRVTYLHEFELMTLARLLIAEYRADPRDDLVEAATALLDRLLESARHGARWGSATEILVLQSLARDAQGQTAEALDALTLALDHGEREGYVRMFVDEGPPMLRLLRAAAGAGIHPTYVRELGQALRQTELTGASHRPILEPLSERELHVVRLLATTLSGPEIARELHVSLNTVRTHTKHIFAKLEVSTRAAAVHRAEALGLI
jgi:LuxR family maltose regulon positive regulatory protein